MVRERIAARLALRPSGERSIRWLAQASNIQYFRLYRLMLNIYDDWQAAEIDRLAAALNMDASELWPPQVGAA